MMPPTNPLSRPCRTAASACWFVPSGGRPLRNSGCSLPASFSTCSAFGWRLVWNRRLLTAAPRRGWRDDNRSASHSSTNAGEAFLLQHVGTSLTHHYPQSAYARRVAGRVAHLSGRLHLSAHLPHSAGTPLYPRGIFQ